MPNTTVYTNNQYYQDIATAIRNKNGQSTLYKPSEMASAINALVSADDYCDTDTSGMDIVYSEKNIDLDGHSYIDTEIALFSEANINKDFKIIIYGLYADSSSGTDGVNDRVSIGCMKEVSPYPGFIIRHNFTASAGTGVIYLRNKVKHPCIVLQRKNGVFIAQTLVATSNITANENYGIKVGSTTNYSTTHDTTLTIGCEKNSSGTPYRYCATKIDSIIVAMGS